MRRRDLLTGSALCAIASTTQLTSAWGAATATDERVAALRSWLDRRGKTPTSARQLAEEISTRAAQEERRILAFELVRALPYRLARFDPRKPDELFVLGFGDCRHKAIALHRLFQALGEKSRTVLMAFDWSDLPLPQAVLRHLDETRGFHDCVEIEIDGRMKLADATWDKALIDAGFPGRVPWDGRQATPAITRNAGPVTLPTEFKSYGELFDRFKIRWPQREKTLAFNRAFNRWAIDLRPAGPLSARS